MNKKIYAALGLVMLASCAQDIDITEANIAPTAEQAVSVQQYRGMLPNVIRIKVEPNVADRIERQLRSNPGALRSFDPAMDKMLQSIGALSVERVFPHAGEFEARQRNAGLHLWYEVDIEDSGKAPYEALAFALTQSREVEGIQMAEGVPMLQEPTTAYKLVEPDAALRTVTSTSGFNDPQLHKQWHYNNVGQTLRSKPGADINLFEAWKMETGKPNVAVAIVDGGVDYLHEDLRDNMHVNEKELNGTEGVDDDGNGFVDDIYGYNFVTDSGDITPHEHGTHVAGTVAARNNNGVGVAGVAGGNGKEQSGARLISCQMFHTNEEGRTISTNNAGARAIVYGANMGAVISQNSWGYRNAPNQAQPLSQVDKEAIDYFIKYAGCDKDGNQLPNSPMKGGVVIFAAGNDGRDYLSYPSAYSAVVAVSSMAPDFTAAYYTNRGEWVNIMAPGGSFLYSKGEVLSTVPDNQYAYMQGTSMACPHVSGIAALIVSKYGGAGFTNEDLKQRLVTALRTEDINELNPKFATRLGAGYIDAALALAPVGKNEAPEAVAEIATKATYTGVEVSWSVPRDANDGTAYSYNLYYSAVEINASNYTKALKVSVPGARQLGKKISYLHEGLSPNTKYYYAVEAVDRWGAVSKSVALGSVMTLENSAPVLRIDDESTIRLTGNESIVRRIIVAEPDAQSWTYEIEGESYDVKHKKVGENEVELVIRVSRPAGKYSVVVGVTDALGLKSTIEVPFEFYKNHAPALIKPFERMYVSQGKTREIHLDDYFQDADKDNLVYSVRTLNPEIATAKVVGNRLQLSGTALGLAGFDVTAEDALGMQTKTGLSLSVVETDLVHAIYPTLVQDYLNIEIQGGVTKVFITVLSPKGTPVLKDQAYSLGTNQKIKLNLAHLPAGTYTLLVEGKDSEFSQSFIKR